MTDAAVVIVIHQIVFQGMFFAKNILLRRKLGIPIRGTNRETNLSVAYFILYILCSVLLSLSDAPLGSVDLITGSTALVVAITLLVVTLFIAASSLVGMGESWRVGVLDDQQTGLVDKGIYQFSRNPYFLSYLIMFAAYTLLLQSIVLLALSLIGFSMIHAMVLKEEKHLSKLHGEIYHQYKKRVPRYFVV